MQCCCSEGESRKSTFWGINCGNYLAIVTVLLQALLLLELKKKSKIKENKDFVTGPFGGMQKRIKVKPWRKVDLWTFETVSNPEIEKREVSPKTWLQESAWALSPAEAFVPGEGSLQCPLGLTLGGITTPAMEKARKSCSPVLPHSPAPAHHFPPPPPSLIWKVRGVGRCPSPKSGHASGAPQWQG